jgi:hypothetical protein
MLNPTDMTAISQGVLDLGLMGTSPLFTGYQAFAVVSNNLPARMLTPTDINRDSVYLTGADVELEPSPALASAIPASQRKFFVAAAYQRLAPGANGMGEAVLAIEVVPRQVANLLNNVVPDNADPSSHQLLARIRPVGKRAGADVVGDWAILPVGMCQNCLAPPPAACPAMPFKTTDVLKGNLCNPPQDAQVTCCTQAGNVLCGPLVPMM